MTYRPTSLEALVDLPLRGKSLLLAQNAAEARSILEITGGGGEQGPAGPQGIAGNDGAPGSDGAQGTQGIQGVPGNDGAAGSQGSQGIQGVPGNDGAAGSQGIQGIPGNDGAAGSQGIQGVPGNDGATGPQGDPGPAAAWGNITGTLSSQTDLQTALDGKQASGTYASGTGSANGTNTGDQTSIVGITGTIAQFNTAVTDGEFATGTGTASGTNTGDNATNTQYSGLAASKQDTLVSATNIKTINSASVLGSGDLVVAGAAPSSTGGVGNSPNASGTQTITHGLGRTPIVIRIHGIGAKIASTSASNNCESHGIWNSSGNRCICRVQGTAAGQSSSSAFAIKVGSAATAFCSGVIQNVGATTFDIAWTESGTSDTTPVYLWEAQ